MSAGAAQCQQQYAPAPAQSYQLGQENPKVSRSAIPDSTRQQHAQQQAEPRETESGDESTYDAYQAETKTHGVLWSLLRMFLRLYE
ncbi:MAG: hypothetical protein OHK0039_31560 [Bacteroidia bacterium]